MKSLRNILILATALIIVVNLPALAQSPEQLYQRGLVKEEGEGAMEEAINLYSQIADNSNADQALRAKALLHIGMCYERMGTQEAVEAYQRLVTDFPTQKNEVAIARERLTLLTPIENKVAEDHKITMIEKKIWEGPDVDDSGEISPDGKYLAYIDWRSGELAIYEIATGKKRLLTDCNPGDGYDQFAFSPRWSPDGEYIYYTAFIAPGLSEIHFIGLNDSKPDTLCKVEGKGKWLEIHDISMDGRFLLATIPTNSETTQFAIVSLPEGNIEIIKEADGTYFENLKFLPGGKEIIYDRPSDVNSHNHDIYTLTIDGNTEKSLVEHSAHDCILGLSRDGKQLLFSSSRSGKLAIWSLDLTNDPENSKPSYIRSSEYSYLTGLDFTETGSFFYCMIPQKSDIYEMEINPVSGKIISEPIEIIEDYVGSNLTPDYSSDGNYLAYVSRRAPFNARELFIPRGNILCIKSLETGQVREIKPVIDNFGFPKWSPDNKQILLVNWDAKKQMGIFLFDVHTEEMTLVAKSENNKFVQHEWAPDGKSAFLVRDDGNGTLSLVKHKLTTGEETVLIKDSWKELYNISCSPDGKWLSFMGRDKNRTLKVIPTSGGEIREIYSWNQGDNRSIQHCWSADGKSIFLQKLQEPTKDLIWNLWQITVENGEAKNLGLEMTPLWQISAHPDGKHIALSNQGSSYKMPEVWMMENFLPSENFSLTSEITKAGEAEGIKIKKIWATPYLDDLGTVSYDGRFRSCVDWEGSGDLALHNLISGEIRPLTHKASLGDTASFVLTTAISKNGKQIVSTWWRPHNTTDLALTNLENNTSDILYSREGEEVYPAAWLSDNMFVALRLIPDQRIIQLVTYNTLTKSLQVKKTFDKIQDIHAACSPDEKYIAYNIAGDDKGDNMDIYLLTANGESDIPLITHPANDMVFGWVPGRKEFLFLSDRSGTWDLWAVTLDETKITGPAKRIYADIGEVVPMGFTQNDKCYFGFVRRNFYTSLAPLNAETGEIDLVSGKSLKGSNYGLTWSPDGQYLAYLKLDDHRNFVIQDLETGEEQKASDITLIPFGFSWSPDGNSILVVGMEKNQLETLGYKGDIFLIDKETGQTDIVLKLSDYEYNVPEDDAFPLTRLEWSPDGKSFYYLLSRDRLVQHDLETGEDKILYKHSNFESYILSLSPDGQNLLFGLKYPGDEKSRLFTIPAEGGEKKEVCTAQEAKGFGPAFWSPDGKNIYFVEILESMKTNLWRVPSKGGNPEKVWGSENRVDIFDIHPDGNQIAFSIRERKTEVRVIENLEQELAKVYDQNE